MIDVKCQLLINIWDKLINVNIVFSKLSNYIGYLNDDDATATTIDVDGWLRTGDIGYVDDDDEVFIVDRVKELIKFKGFQACHFVLISSLTHSLSLFHFVNFFVSLTLRH